MKMLRAILGLLFMLSVPIFWTITRFSNPDMTEMRLLFNFWPYCLLSIIFLGIGYFLVSWRM